jgi:hypothetical protein
MPQKDYNYVSLNAQLLANDAVVSERTVVYDCDSLGASVCTVKHIASKTEQNTALYVVVTLLALMTLLAILTYKRKSTLQDAEMHNSENN